MQEHKLFESIKLDDCDKVKELLKEGVDPTIPIAFWGGKTAIGFCVSQNKPKILLLLLKSCQKEFFDDIDVDEDDDEGISIFFPAFTFGWFDDGHSA